MNINFWKDEWWNKILINKEWYLFNLFSMIENWYFEWKMNKKVISIIKKTDDELLEMWFDVDDINKIRKQTSPEVLVENWFDIEKLILFYISKNKKEFVTKIMNLLENWENSKESNYLCNLPDFKKVKLWLEMPDLDVISWSKKRGEEKFKNMKKSTD